MSAITAFYVLLSNSWLRLITGYPCRIEISKPTRFFLAFHRPAGHVGRNSTLLDKDTLPEPLLALPTSK